MIRTQKDIDVEVKKLEDLKSRLVVTHSAFGNDHGKTIQVQIDVLNDDMVQDEIDDLEEDDLRCAAQDAADWFEGRGDAPSKSWIDSPHLFAKK